jgi:D-amino-acid dehydrogenase
VTRVAVIGAGVIGLCCAYELANRGVEVQVLDAGTAGCGASRGNTGWVTPSITSPLAGPGMIRMGLHSAVTHDNALVIRPSLDPAFLRWLWRFRQRCSAAAFREGIEVLAALNRYTMERLDAYHEAGVDFEMHATGLVVAATGRDALGYYHAIFGELERLGVATGLARLSPSEAALVEPALNRDALREALHARIDRFVRPESLVRGLAAWLSARGGAIREGRRVTSLRRAGAGWVLRAAGDELRADRVVIATGVAATTLTRPLGVSLPIVGAKGYSITATGTGVAPTTALYLAEAKIGISGYHGAVRIAGTFEIPGRDGVADRRRIDALVASTRPYLRDWQPVDPPIAVWAGLRPATPDGMPFIDQLPGADGVFVAAGHGMLGVTLGPATGHLLAPFVLDGSRPSELEPLRIAERRGDTTRAVAGG